MLGIGRLYLTEEGGDVGVVAEADESLGFVAGYHNIVAFVLTAELVVVLHVELAAGVALDAHVAGAMVGVVPVEADGEVAFVLLHAGLSHKVYALLVHKGAVVDVQFFGPGFHQHAHLHWDEVKHPRGVSHLLGKVTEFGHVRAAPDALKVAGLGAEGILHKLRANIGKRAEGHHLEVGPVVVQEVIIQLPAVKELFTELHGVLEVAVVAAAYGAVDDSRVLFAYIGVLSGPYP